jgi:hypothetical protein
MMEDLRGAVWTELRSGGSITVYRRNLQRGYLERMAWLMTEEPRRLPSFSAGSVNGVNVSQSDIRAYARGELGICNATSGRP